MSEDYMTDSHSTTKTHGIRSGEPKRPESLIEMPSIVPEVPEVSLCFNQEKSPLLKLNRASTVEVPGMASDYHQHHQQNEMLHKNKYESYNTWKAKNAQALHSITGGLERVELGSKRASNTKRSAGLIRKQISGKDMQSPPIVAVKYRTNGASEQFNSARQNDSTAELNPRLKENYAQTQLMSNQSSNTQPVEHHCTGYPGYSHNFPQHQLRDSQKDFQQTEESFKNPVNLSSNLPNNYTNKHRVDENISYSHQVNNKSNHNGRPICCVPNYCNKLQCSCDKQKALINSSNGNQFINDPALLEASRANHNQCFDATNLYSPLDSGLIYNHLSSLSHVVNIQKEQMTMLCQEISTQKMLISALLEEVKQIHLAVSPNVQRNCDISPTKKKSCQNCTCEQKHHEGIRSDTSEDSKEVQIKHNGHLTSKQLPISHDYVEKRSVGVMTSSLDNSVNPAVPSNGKDKVQDNVSKSKNQRKQPRDSNSPSNKNKQTNKKELTQREEKRNLKSNQVQRRKNKKEESNESSQSDDSFSLDEAAVIMRSEAEQGDLSPDISIHVNMPDYSALSAESDTSNTSDSDDDGLESGSECESSDPQIGWTFYDRVVGQVNNMLKKTSNNPRQEYAHIQRKNTGNVLYQCNGDYETENNWSKRVTFDGPPLEDSDNNGMNMPRYHHFRTNQDYRMPGGPERMQDFLMCDYSNGGNNLSLANGSTNVSFATYRYYQRHHLLPPPPPPAGVRVPDQVFTSPPQMKKKSSKSRKNEKTSPPKKHKRRSGGPPSKILDVSALNHQPKLF